MNLNNPELQPGDLTPDEDAVAAPWAEMYFLLEAMNEDLEWHPSKAQKNGHWTELSLHGYRRGQAQAIVQRTSGDWYSMLLRIDSALRTGIVELGGESWAFRAIQLIDERTEARELESDEDESEDF